MTPPESVFSVANEISQAVKDRFSRHTPLITGLSEIPKFDEEELVKALRIDQE